MRTDALVDFGSIFLHPTEHRRVIHTKSALTHHLFNIAIGKLVTAVPANAEQDDIRGGAWGIG
jgi:hypothetical protein